jgi:CHAT domain-containing protein
MASTFFVVYAIAARSGGNTSRPSKQYDRAYTLSQVHTPDEFALWKEGGAITSTLLNEIGSEARRLVEAGDFESAYRLSDWYLRLAGEIRDPAMRARAALTTAVTFLRTNQSARALEYFDEAIVLFLESGNELWSAIARVDRVSCYGHLGRYEEALRDSEINNEVLTRLGEKRRLAMSLNNHGEILFRLERFQEWMTALGKAAKLLEEIGDHQSLALIYMNQALALTSLNWSDEAILYYRLSRDLADGNGQKWLAARCNYNLGHLHYTIGEYTRAIDILTETRRALAGDPWYCALCDLTQSEIYLEINMYRDAIEFANSAHKGFQAIEKPFDVARAIGVMAIARSQLREFQEAERLFGQAKTMFKSQGKSGHAAGVELHRSVMLLHLGRYAQAREAAEEAYNVFVQEDLQSKPLVNVIIQPATPYTAFIKEDAKSKAAFTLIISARASIRLGELDRAQNDAALAGALHEQSPLPVVGYQLHALNGTIHACRDDLASARTEFQRAIDEFEGVRANISRDELRLNYLKDKVPVYEMLLSADLRLWEQTKRKEILEEAFEAAERSKSRTLTDLLAGSVASLKQMNISSIEEVRQALAPDAVLVEYVIVNDEVSAFCLSHDDFAVTQNICSKNELSKRFGFVQYHLDRFAYNPEGAKARGSMALFNIQDHLQKLYEMLIRPLEEFLVDATSLVVVPFDFLHYLPFHALFDGSLYLADRFIISYAPAATIHRMFIERHARSEGNALLIGVPDEAAPLIGAEIDGIRSVTPNARSFIGSAATRECLTREMETARIIHIASHATFRQDNPLFSSIQLHDGSINFFDIYNLRTSASLITLSGCGTGLSKVVAGDELLGLVRGFLYAGATSVVISLWDVNDRTTADLMRYFYANLAAGHSKGESLKLAMLRLRKDEPHPYYWAPFLLIGDAS